MPTGFNVPFQPYSKLWEIKKICIFIGVEASIVLTAILYRQIIVKRSVLGPTDDELRRRDQAMRPELWEEYERHVRQRNQSFDLSLASLSAARKSNSNLLLPDSNSNPNSTTRDDDDTVRLQKNSGIGAKGLDALEEVLEELPPSMKPKAELDGYAGFADANRQRVRSAGAKPVLAINTQAPFNNAPHEKEAAGQLQSRPRQEMAEVFPPLAKLQPDASSSVYDSPRTRSPSSIVRMYTENDTTYLGEPYSIVTGAQQNLSPVSKLSGANVESIGAHSSEGRPSRSRYRQSFSPIDKNGRKGRESVSPKELKRQGVLRKVRENVRKSSVAATE